MRHTQTTATHTHTHKHTQFLDTDTVISNQTEEGYGNKTI